MATDHQQRSVETDERVLDVLVTGPTSGDVLLFHGGTPSAAAVFRPLADAAAARGLRVVTYSRPGYATSTPMPGRTVADGAADSAAVLDALGVDRFVTLGYSGGGPHALACAALLPERCAAAASLAGVAPYDAEGLDWLAGMGEENVEEFTLASRGEDALTPWLQAQAEALSVVSPDDIAQALGGLVSPVDVESLSPEFADFLAAAFRRAVSTGIAGWRDDDLAFVGDWGVDLVSISVPVAVWQGGQDRMVPYGHGVWLAEHVRHARKHLHDDDGHLSLVVGAIDRVVDDLVELAA